MIAVVFFLFLSSEVYAIPEVCTGLTCGGWKSKGLMYDWRCDVTDDNEVLILPPGLVNSAQQCESFSLDSPLSNWYTYRKSGACELLSYCTDSMAEEGSITGPDPGEGETCYEDMTTTASQTTSTPEPTSTSEEATTQEPTTTEEPTTTSPTQEVLLVLGGDTATGDISSVDVITQDLEVISRAFPDAPGINYAWTAGLIDDQVVVCGGGYDRGFCQHLNLTSRTWESQSTLVTGRSWPASTVHDGVFYVFGGNSFGELTSVERYHSTDHSWSSVPQWEMPEGKTRFCVVQHSDYIYQMGGFDIEDESVMWRLSTSTGLYELMPSMLEPRYGQACVLTNIAGEDGILVTGGISGTYTSSTAFYSFAGQKWQSLANMNYIRAYHGIGVLNGKPVVFGGYGSPTHTDTLEVYDDIDQKWHVVEGSKLTQPKRDFAYVKVPQWTPSM